MSNFVALGEILIDFMPDRTPDGQPLYAPHVGGAPANVARAMAVLGHSSAFIGKVGTDSFGEMCKQVLEEDGVDTSGLVSDNQRPTTLAFVHLSDEGERSFSFYRNQTADVSLSEADVPAALVDSAHIFHIGSVSLTDNPSAETTLASIKRARQQGAVISYDPNLRPRLWKDMTASRDTILKPLRFCDVVKISDEETEFIGGQADPEQAARQLYDLYHIPLILISLGKHGCCALHNGHFYTEPGFAVKAVDTTGAGDCFFAGILHCVLESGKAPADMTPDEISAALRFANAMGAAAVQHKGAGCPGTEAANTLLQNL